MKNYKLYPTLQTEPSTPMDPQAYSPNMVQGKQQELLRLEKRYMEKYKKYSEILDRLMWLNTCLSGLSMASEISSVATLSTFIGLLLSIPLGAVSLGGMSVSGMVMVLTKKYQKKVTNVMKLVDIITLALAVLETSISKTLNDGRVDEREFTMLQTFHLGVLNELANIDHKMEAETRAHLQKSILEEINNLKKAIRYAS